MSGKLQSQVYEKKIGGSEKAVLLILADFANDDGICWPTQGRIAWKADCSPRTVGAAIAKLKQLGVVEELQSGRGRSGGSLIRLHIDRLPDKPPYEPMRQKKSADSADLKLAENDTKSAISDTKSAMAIADKPSIEPSIEPSESVSIAREAEKPSGYLAELFAAYARGAEIREGSPMWRREYNVAAIQISQLATVGITLDPSTMERLTRYTVAAFTDMGASSSPRLERVLERLEAFERWWMAYCNAHPDCARQPSVSINYDWQPQRRASGQRTAGGSLHVNLPTTEDRARQLESNPRWKGKVL